MEVVSPIARSPDFRFNTTTYSPYTTAPSSPRPFGDPFGYQYHYTSAPASPTRAAAIYSDFTAWAYHQPVGHPSPDTTNPDNLFEKQERGRNSFAGADSTRNGLRASRSFSPKRNDGLLAKCTSPSTNPVKCGLSRKWPRLKDLLLFRSASEGRATGRGSKDPLQKYTVLPSVPLVNKKTGGGGQTARRGSAPAVSAHEKLYTANRAAAEEQKRKTPLPFQRHGLIGLVHFNPAGRGKNKPIGGGASSFSKGRF